MYKFPTELLSIAGVIVLTCSTTGGFAADTPSDAEKRAACTSDVMQFCVSMIPSMDKIEACLRGHRPQLSTTCRALFEKYESNTDERRVSTNRK
jgi:hypothetical protein